MSSVWCWARWCDLSTCRPLDSAHRQQGHDKSALPSNGLVLMPSGDEDLGRSSIALEPSTPFTATSSCGKCCCSGACSSSSSSGTGSERRCENRTDLADTFDALDVSSLRSKPPSPCETTDGPAPNMESTEVVDALVGGSNARINPDRVRGTLGELREIAAALLLGPRHDGRTQTWPMSPRKAEKPNTPSACLMLSPQGRLLS
mmetsp:Transcript_21323/g.61469  ORF Transcript_21323/g.61469 Transcript_21323/m.61469 type:complete len:203 (-) Transcript_21323:1040-1648(-)